MSGLSVFSLVGQAAPPFKTAAAFDGETADSPIRTVSLSDYVGKWLVFFWYPLDFTAVCPTEILAMSDRLDEFSRLEAEVLGASTDSIFTHRAWMSTPRQMGGISGVKFPILADKTYTVARDWGVLIEDAGIALRGLFIIDPKGVVQYSVTQNLSTGRSVDETLRVLAAVQTGEFCACGWEPGQKTLSAK